MFTVEQRDALLEHVRRLDDRTRTLADELDAEPLVDLERGPTTYRVFLLPDALQLDLSMSPAAASRCWWASGPTRAWSSG